MGFHLCTGFNEPRFVQFAQGALAAPGAGGRSCSRAGTLDCRKVCAEGYGLFVEGIPFLCVLFFLEKQTRPPCLGPRYLRHAQMLPRILEAKEVVGPPVFAV